MPSAKPPVQLVLFKPTDLRLHDHQPLHTAHRQAAASGVACLHVLVLDTRWFDGTCRSREAKLPRIGRLRGTFLLQSVAMLADALASRGHTLLVVRARTARAARAATTASTATAAKAATAATVATATATTAATAATARDGRAEGVA